MVIELKCVICDGNIMDQNKTEEASTSRCAKCGMPYHHYGEVFWCYPAAAPSDILNAKAYWDTHHMVVFPSDYMIMRVCCGEVKLVECTEKERSTWNRFIVPF